MSTVSQNSLIDHRAKALANVFLMGRNSIVTYAIPDLGEINLLARFLPEGDEHEKLFAVILKGTSVALATEREAATWLNQWARQKKHVQKFPFPVLILVFSMQNDDGYFAWHIEPTRTMGIPKLKLNTNLIPQRTSKKGLDIITQELDGWYSDLYKSFRI